MPGSWEYEPLSTFRRPESTPDSRCQLEEVDIARYKRILSHPDKQPDGEPTYKN
jgi:hypothetical protein